MIRLDHFVIQIDNNFERLTELKEAIEPMGVPLQTWSCGDFFDDGYSC